MEKYYVIGAIVQVTGLIILIWKSGAYIGKTDEILKALILSQQRLTADHETISLAFTSLKEKLAYEAGFVQGQRNSKRIPKERKPTSED